MELNPGYKQTEVGVIPEEWGASSIGDIAQIHVGRDLREDSFSSVNDSTHRYPVYSNTVDDFGLYGYYSTPDYDGESLTIVGRGVGLGTAFPRSGGYGAIGRLIVLFPNQQADSRFIAAYINNRVTIYHESSGIPQLTGIGIAKYKIAVPPKAEQRAIAAALSDVDVLLTKLDQFIAKKRDIKQAAMQQLLTGKKRLPGFSGEWETVALRDIANYVASGKSKVTATYGTYPVYGSTGVIGYNEITDYADDAILVARVGANAGKLNLVTDRYGVTDNTIILRLNSSQYLPFFWYQLQTKRLNTLVFGSGQPLITGTQLKGLTLRVPPLSEQTAIASVLSDMDTEIAALEARRDKTRALKQGMMQELLTGRIRLV